MLTSYVTGLLAVVVMMLAWVGVMSAWRRVFPDATSDPDVLAGRMTCHGCTGDRCTTQECGSSACELDEDRRNHGRVAAEEDTP